MVYVVETPSFTYSLNNHYNADNPVICIETTKSESPHPRTRIIRGTRICGDVVRGGQLIIKRRGQAPFKTGRITNLYLT